MQRCETMGKIWCFRCLSSNFTKSFTKGGKFAKRSLALWCHAKCYAQKAEWCSYLAYSDFRCSASCQMVLRLVIWSVLASIYNIYTSNCLKMGLHCVCRFLKPIHNPALCIYLNFHFICNCLVEVVFYLEESPSVGVKTLVRHQLHFFVFSKRCKYCLQQQGTAINLWRATVNSLRYLKISS